MAESLVISIVGIYQKSRAKSRKERARNRKRDRTENRFRKKTKQNLFREMIKVFC